MAWAPNYLTVEELKRLLRIDAEDTQDDAELALAITAASRAADRFCNRQFGLVAAPEARYFTALQSERWKVRIDDLMTTSGLTVHVDLDDSGDYASEITNYVLTPQNASVEGKPWELLEVRKASEVQPTAASGAVKVVARWGWSAIPEAVKQAVGIQANRFNERRNSPYGIAGSPEIGSELRLMDKIDPDVEVILTPFRKRWWFV